MDDNNTPQERIDSEEFSEPARPRQRAGATRDKDQSEANRAQAESDAPPDSVAEGGASDGDPINTSDSSGLRQSDEAAGDLRKKQYKDGAGLVSSTD